MSNRPTPPNSPGTDIEVVVNTLVSTSFQQEIKAFLPGNADLRKFMQAAIVAVQRNAEMLAKCDKQSVYNAIADAASRNLVPDGRQGALVPYRTRKKVAPNQWIDVVRCQFLIMPEGIIESAARSGTAVYAVSIYADDHVRLWNDLEGQHFEHDYSPFSDRGARVGAVAVAKLRNGQTYVEAMNMDELKRAMQASKQKDDQGNPTGPWRDWPERMEQKSVLHRLNKRIPGIALDDDEEYVGPSDRIRIAPEPVVSGLTGPVGGPVSPSAVAAALAPRPENTAGPRRPRALQRVIDQDGAVVAQGDKTPGGAEPAATEPGATPAPASGSPSPGPEGEPF
jgi:phage RecT family recombinase